MARTRLAKNRALPENLYQNKAGYYYYVNPQSKKSKGLGRDKAHAFTEARAANAALATLKPSTLTDWLLGKTDYSLQEWLPIYLDLWLHKNEALPAPSTQRNCRTYLKQIALAPFAWRKMEDITTAHVAPFLIDLEKTSGAGAAKNLRSRLSDVCRMAETQGVIKPGRNPVTATYSPSRSVKRERLSLEQFLLIREEAPLWLKRAMNLALVTAQRREDIAKMKFTDIKAGHLHVIQNKGRVRVRLALDLNIKLDAIGLSIGEAIDASRDGLRSAYLTHHTRHKFTVKPGDKLSTNGLTWSFNSARDAAGIKATEGRTPPTFHEIRSLSERLYRKQLGAAFAQSLLGHKSASMTERYDDLRGQGWALVTA